MNIRLVIKKAVCVIFAAAMCATACGCSDIVGSGSISANIINAEDSSDSGVLRAYLPTKKENGQKFKIAYVDIDPYNAIFKMLFYVIESLKNDGWLAYEELPFDPDTDSDSCALINWVADNAQSDYLQFDKTANYYTTVSTEDEIRESLRDHIEVKKDIDIILTMGTSPSAMVQRFGFDIPLLMYGVSDPVGSGLIVSPEDSGNKNYWAHVDSSAYTRQMQYYFNTFNFTKLGSVYGDEVVCALPDYRKAAQDNAFAIKEYQLKREDYEDEELYYADLKAIYKKMINEDKVDAYILNTNVITDDKMAVELIQPFFDAGIPVFSQASASSVIEGASLLIVDPRDAEGTAPFVAYAIGAILNGADPNELEQEYISSPFLTLNLDVADKIGFNPSFEMLIACEKIICTE